MNDKRAACAPRIAMQVPVQLQLGDEFGFQPGGTCDLSVGGALIETMARLEPLEALGVVLSLGDGTAPVLLRAEVRWVRPLPYPQTLWRIGLAFTRLADPADEARLRGALEAASPTLELPGDPGVAAEWLSLLAEPAQVEP